MPPKQKSIFRRPEAQHFQLVHRSQRDPLIHDPEASLHVLKPFRRENDAKKGKSLVDIEAYVPNTDKERHNIGEAAEHGIFFDDTEYDYMQHLRDPTSNEDEIETILIPAPTSTSKNNNTKSHSKPFELKLPPDVLPPTKEIDDSKALEAQRDIPDDIARFNPDLDPHLRQVIQALDEDAFVDDNLDDSFFGELVEGGEREDDDDDFEFHEDDEGDTGSPVEDEEPWQAEFAKFKKQQELKDPGDNEDSNSGSGILDTDARSQAESLDTLGNLPVVIGGKRRRRGAATASSGFSMTSSAIYRNAGLTLLDERFEQFDKTYDDDDIPSDPDGLIDSDPDEAPDLIAARDDFEAVMDDFLTNYELVGGRMRPVLQGTTGVDKLDTIRRALGQVRITGDENENDDAVNDSKDAILMPTDIDEEKERWDCETILSTYSNLENHPRLIRVRNTKPTPQIKLDPKTGLPVTTSRQALLEDLEEEEEDSQDSDATEQPGRMTITRPRNESKDEKKARKLAVKKERQARRQDKKANQEIFSKERKQLAKVMIKRGDMKVKKL